MELETRFPKTFSKCEEFNKKYKIYEPNLDTNNGITYDRSVIPILTDDEIEMFINLQLKYPEIIKECFDNLIKILENQENQDHIVKIKKVTKKNRNQNIHMKQIYDLLINLNEHNNDMEIIDKWVLFIKSQNEFSKFF